MKTTSTLLAFLLCATLHAQDFQPPNPYFQQTFDGHCPFDSTVTITLAEDWLVYQTLDGRWDGPIDSTRCIGLSPLGFGIQIELDQIDPALPLFVRSGLHENPYLIDPDWVFNIAGEMYGSDDFLRQDTDCENGLCTGILIGILVPDEDMDSTNLRTYAGQFDPNFFGYGNYPACVPTEYFASNQWSELIFKITLDTTAEIPVGAYIRLFQSGLYMLYEVGHISEVVAQEWTFTDTSYQVPVYTLANDGWQNYLMMYDPALGYPSETNQHFIEAYPEVQPDFQTTINVLLSFEESLLFQPYTNLRGAFVAGSDTLRHEVNIVNEGGNICINLVEVIFEEGANYVHREGEIDLHGKGACMQFRNGGAFVLPENTSFTYGEGGRGMLALRSGGTIRLNGGSHFTIDNTVKLYAYGPLADDPAGRQVYIDLPPGSRFRFGPNASVIAPFDPDGSMKLHFYMNGGELDDQLLSPESRQLIRRIYPPQTVAGKLAFNAGPNPVAAELLLQYQSKKDEPVTLRFIDLHGRLAQEFSLQARKGWNEWALPVGDLPAGLYSLVLSAGGERGIVKVLKQ
ncbi:MAG: T9SS type A sorting domain-containing protein [Saprospiraceae bacterium]|nr:T9SS type A sorting domain-containing protein [Saprospiraceae bacterium]MCB0675754.1 T9SS type A sorting domain-containing protein [Saprospiraceae bacterium]